MFNVCSRTTFLTGNLVVCMLLICGFTGCVGAMSQLLYVIKGHDVPAAYGGLAEKRVAVVCVSDASAYGPDRLTHTVSKAVSMKLARGVKKIEIVSQAQIDDWIDQNAWDQYEFSALGQGVNADAVVAIEIASYSIHEGQTIYKGRADVTVTVYDLTAPEGSQVAHVYGPREFTFPKNGHPSMQSNDRQFESLFLARLTQDISNQFCKHDRLESFAEDAISQ